MLRHLVESAARTICEPPVTGLTRHVWRSAIAQVRCEVVPATMSASRHLPLWSATIWTGGPAGWNSSSRAALDPDHVAADADVRRRAGAVLGAHGELLERALDLVAAADHQVGFQTDTHAAGAALDAEGAGVSVGGERDVGDLGPDVEAAGEIRGALPSGRRR